MEPQGGDPPVPVDSIVYPKWVEDLRNMQGPTFALAGGANAGANSGSQTSSASAASITTGIASVVLAYLAAMVSL